MQYEKICEICGKIFMSSSHNAKYCSSKCYEIKQKLRRDKLKLLPKPMIKCLWCHLLFASFGRKKYCSPECGYFYSKKLSRIFNFFQFSGNVEGELASLQELGSKYKFPEE